MNGKGVTPSECRYLKMRKHGKIDVFHMHFESVGNIELFLKNNPDININSFTDLKSKSAKEEFAGEDLDTAISYCVGGYNKNYDQFLELSKKLDSVNKEYVNVRRVETSFVGQRPNVPAYIADAPKTMYRTRRVEAKKSINIYMNVAYDMKTTEEQILNRGIIALNLIRLLENNGYIVNFRLFESCMVYNEVFLCEVVIKKPGSKLNPRLSYYPLCGKSFLRRILSRIKESMPFKENWGLSYGTVLDEKYTRIIVGIDERDIYIGSPSELNIKGENIYEDADSFIEKIGVGNKIKVPKYNDFDIK